MKKHGFDEDDFVYACTQAWYDGIDYWGAMSSYGMHSDDAIFMDDEPDDPQDYFTMFYRNYYSLVEREIDSYKELIKQYRRHET